MDNNLTAFFSLETSAELLINRILSINHDIDSFSLRTGNVSDEDMAKVDRLLKSDLKHLAIIDEPTLSASKLRNFLKRQPNLRVVFIDYLQLMETEKSNSRNIEVAALTRQLKLMAMELSLIHI